MTQKDREQFGRKRHLPTPNPFEDPQPAAAPAESASSVDAPLPKPATLNAPVLDAPIPESLRKDFQEKSRQKTETDSKENTPESPAPKSKPGRMDEEFQAVYGSGEPEGDKKERPAKKMDKKQIDRIGLIAAGILFLALLIAVPKFLLSNPPQSDDVSVNSHPKTPMKGEIVVIDKASSGWRKRTSDDVTPAEVDALTGAREYPAFLPQIALNLKSAKDGFVRVLFFDENNVATGDTRVFQISGGTAVPSKGVLVNGSEILISSSRGIRDSNRLAEYQADDGQRWHVQISESSTDKGSNADWKVLDEFSIANTEL